MRKYTSLTITVFMLLTLCLLYSFNIKNDPKVSLPVANTDAGRVSGIRNVSGDVTAFKGIPFAAPPVGDLRWKAPQPVKHWNGIRKCEDFGPSPMQGKPAPMMVYTSEFLIPEKPISEDCLYLNVWTSARKKTDKKPVLVWIYGGGFVSGGSAVPIYDGEALAKKGIIFVSINYRVGAFGFLAHPELSKESEGKGSGNYGLLDQIAALQWVKRNIADFGGDPDNVTIAGQSAGSMSVSCLVASPLTTALFKRAIAESGSLLTANPYFSAVSLSSAEEKGIKMTDKGGLHTITEMRNLSAEDVMKLFPGLYAPVIDGYVLPEPIADIFSKNKQNHVPLIIGWNADEGIGTSSKKKEEYKTQAEKRYGADAAQFLTYFPGESDEQAARSETEFSRNQIFALSGYKWAGIQSQYSNSPVYVYNFNRKVPATGSFVQYGAFHTAEVPYAMDNLKFLKNRPLEESDTKLAGLMSEYWINFIKSGNPNSRGLTDWPTYDTTNSLVKVFDTITQTEKLPNKGGFDFMLLRSDN